MSEIPTVQVKGTATPITDHPDVKEYSYVTTGYITELVENDPLTRAQELARAYQNAIEKYDQLDQNKVELWKTIRDRLDRAYANREETGSIEAFTPSWVRKKLNVNAPKAYHADVGGGLANDVDPKRWWNDCGIDVSNLRGTVRKELFPFLKQENTDKSADELADEIAIDGWDPQSEFVTFGRKVLILETAIEVFAEELRLYVFYGGGEKYGVDGGKRDYDWIRNQLGYDVFTGTVSYKSSKALVMAPPPSPFLAMLMQFGHYGAQLNYLTRLTKDLHKSNEGREFLHVAIEDGGPWQLHPEVETPKQFYLVGDQPTSWVQNNQGRISTVESIETLLGRHMGFNLLSFIDDPSRNNSRAAKPGSQNPPKAGSQFQWFRWNSEKNVFEERDDERGTIFRWRNRQFDSSRCPFKTKTWELRNNPTGKRLAVLVQRALKGAGQLLGRNCTITADHPPSSDFSDTEARTKAVRMNAAATAGIGLNLTPYTKAAQGAFTVQSNIVDYVEDMEEAGEDVLDKCEQWRDATTIRGVSVAGAIFASTYAVLKITEATRSDGSIPMRDWNAMVGIALQGTDMLNDLSDNAIKRWINARITGQITEQAVDMTFEAAGTAIDLIDATYTARDASYIYSHGQTGKGVTLGMVAGLGYVGGIVGFLASGATGTSFGGIAVPHLYLVSAICAIAAVLLTIATVTFFDVWSDLEKWVLHSSFGKNHGNLTGQSERYYGFEDDYGRQLSVFQGEQYADTVDTCYVARGEDWTPTTEPFKFVMSGLAGLSEESELLLCALPDENRLPEYKQRLYPLLDFKLGWSKQELKKTTMPSGLTFGQADTLTVDTYEVRQNSSGPGDVFEINCSLGSNADPVELFREHFLSPPAREDWMAMKGWPIKDWGWEVLYYPGGMPAKQRSALQEVDNTGLGSQAFHKLLFSLPVPRLRLQMAKQSTGVFAFDNQILTGNR